MSEAKSPNAAPLYVLFCLTGVGLVLPGTLLPDLQQRWGRCRLLLADDGDGCRARRSRHHKELLTLVEMDWDRSPVKGVDVAAGIEDVTLIRNDSQAVKASRLVLCNVFRRLFPASFSLYPWLRYQKALRLAPDRSKTMQSGTSCLHALGGRPD